MPYISTSSGQSILLGQPGSATSGTELAICHIPTTTTTASTQIKQAILVSQEPQTLGKDLECLDRDALCGCTGTWPATQAEHMKI